MKLKKLINYRKQSQNQTTIIYKNNQSKNCRAAEEFWRFYIERRDGRGSLTGGCCGAGGVIVSEKPSSSSIVMGFSNDPTSCQGKRKSSTC